LAAPVMITVGSLGVLVGTFWPWVASGRRNRSSYQIFEVVERLGFAPGGAVGWGLRLWPIVPLLVVCASIAAWYRRRLAAGLLAGLGALYAGGVGLAMGSAPRSGLVRVLGAPTFTAIASGVLLAGAVVVLIGAVRDRMSQAR